jgi:hypothetical protein
VLDERGSIPSRAIFFSSHPPSFPMVPGSFLRGKVAEACSLQLSPSGAEIECVELYLQPSYVYVAWCLVKHQGQLYLFKSSLLDHVLSQRSRLSPWPFVTLASFGIILPKAKLRLILQKIRVTLEGMSSYKVSL